MNNNLLNHPDKLLTHLIRIRLICTTMKKFLKKRRVTAEAAIFCFTLFKL